MLLRTMHDSFRNWLHGSTDDVKDLTAACWASAHQQHVPLQVFVNGEFIGGSDILLEMHKSGELEKMVDQLQEGQQAQQQQQ